MWSSAFRNPAQDPNPRIECRGTRRGRSRRQFRVSTCPRTRMPAALECLRSEPKERGGLAWDKIACRLDQQPRGFHDRAYSRDRRFAGPTRQTKKGIYSRQLRNTCLAARLQRLEGFVPSVLGELLLPVSAVRFQVWPAPR